MSVIIYRRIRDDEEKTAEIRTAKKEMVEAFPVGTQRILPSEQQTELRHLPDSR